MAMSRKHYEALAAALKVAKPSVGFLETPKAYDAAALRAWEHACMAVMDVCHADNPRFNYERFGKACGYDA